MNRALMSTFPSSLFLPTFVNWMETFDNSTGAYDRALTEVVLEAVAFGWKPPAETHEGTKWWCIECVLLSKVLCVM